MKTTAKTSSKESLISFDPICPLVGYRDKSGFSLISEKLNYQDVLNFLCDNFGEGNLINGAMENDNWSIREGYRYFGPYEDIPPKGFRLIVFDKKIIDGIFEKFGINIPLDNTNTIEHYIAEAISPLLFSKITSKRIRKLQHLIATKLNMLGHNVQWYDIDYNWDTQIVNFNIKDTEFSIRI